MSVSRGCVAAVSIAPGASDCTCSEICCRMFPFKQTSRYISQDNFVVIETGLKVCTLIYCAFSLHMLVCFDVGPRANVRQCLAQINQFRPTSVHTVDQ